MSAIEEILNFWFGDSQTDESHYQNRRKVWFGKSTKVDQEIRDRFLPIYMQGKAGELNDWKASPESCLALIVLLDQFPRNIFRGTPQAFATDPQALAAAKEAIAQGFDLALESLRRMFIYLPLEHSENLADQIQSVTLLGQLYPNHPELEDTFSYAMRHLEVIERFGRFPHRNSILGRTSTPEEVEFLKQRGSTF